MRKLSLFIALALFLSIAVWYGRPVDPPSTDGFPLRQGFEGQAEEASAVWNSPDETANAFWAARVAKGEPLQVFDALIGFGEGAMHPRSMSVVGEALVPGSFPGIILLYGVFLFIFKLPLFLYTPILTVFAAACLRALVSKLFDRNVGAWAAILFLVHPAILYYGARGMFHNVLFVDALILAAALFALRPLRAFFGARASADDALGGFILAWALVVRTSEAIWVIPAFAAFLPFAGKERWRRLGVAVLGAIVPILIFLKINATLYGSPLRTAYVPPPPAAAEAVVAAPRQDAAFEAAPSAVLPFGVHPRLAARNVWNYGLKLFWWQSILAAVGFAWWVAGFRKASGPQKAYALAALLTAVWLALLYGSWLIRDRFDPREVTIGTSYVRYFLPAYVAALPFAAFALVRCAELLRKRHMAYAILAVCAILGVRSAVFVGDESLRAVRHTLLGNAEKKLTLLEMIEPGSVVMTERFDKLLVPERLRIIPATDAGAFAAAARAAEFASVYWYGLHPTDDEALRLSELAGAHGLIWYEVGRPAPGEALYVLDLYEDEEHDHVEEEPLDE